MSKESAAPLLEQRKPRAGGELASSQPMPILPKLPRDVKVLRDFVKRRHIPLVDMLEVEFMRFAVFNLADSFICVCAFLYVLLTLLKKEPESDGGSARP